MFDVPGDNCLDVLCFRLYAYTFGVFAVMNRVHQVGSQARNHAHGFQTIVAVVFAGNLD